MLAVAKDLQSNAFNTITEGNENAVETQNDHI